MRGSEGAAQITADVLMEGGGNPKDWPFTYIAADIDPPPGRGGRRARVMVLG